ncbi:MAG: hypothetical protein RSF40_10515 [Oscillospiraceae bacterium]
MEILLGLFILTFAIAISYFLSKYIEVYYSRIYLNNSKMLYYALKRAEKYARKLKKLDLRCKEENTIAIVYIIMWEKGFEITPEEIKKEIQVIKAEKVGL